MKKQRDGADVGAANLESDEISVQDPELTTRIRVVCEQLGWERAAALSDKSVKQLRRYVQGAEPPFSVIVRLARGAGITLTWLSAGKTASAADCEAAAKILNAELAEVRRQLRSAASVDDLTKLKDYEALALKRISLNDELLSLFRQHPELEDSPYTLLSSRDNTQNLQGSNGAIDDDLFRAVRKLVARVHADEKVRLPQEALFDEVVRWYKEVWARGEDSAERLTQMGWLETRLRKELQAARTEPGTGKRSV